MIKNINRWIIAVFVVILFLFAISMLSTSQNSSERDVYGWGYNNQGGWLSFNSESANHPYTQQDFRVVFFEDGNRLAGQAWSSVYGWVSFNESDVSDCSAYTNITATDCSPRIIKNNDNEEYEVRGFAKISSLNKLISFNSKDITGSLQQYKVKAVPKNNDDSAECGGGEEVKNCFVLEGCAYSDATGWWGFGENAASDCSSNSLVYFSQDINTPQLSVLPYNSVVYIDVVNFVLNCNSDSDVTISGFSIIYQWNSY